MLWLLVLWPPLHIALAFGVGLVVAVTAGGLRLFAPALEAGPGGLWGLRLLGVLAVATGAAGLLLDPRPASFTDAVFWETRDRDRIVNVITNGAAAVGGSPLMVAWSLSLSADQIEQISGMAHLTGIVVEVTAAAGAHDPESWSGCPEDRFVAASL